MADGHVISTPRSAEIKGADMECPYTYSPDWLYCGSGAYGVCIGRGSGRTGRRGSASVAASANMSEEDNRRTLYVGNLDASVSEDLLCAFFSQIGSVKVRKIIRKPDNDSYAFVEFTNHQCAATALAAMNKRLCLDKEMKINWAGCPGNQPKHDTSNHHDIFVGDLSPEIETHTLKEAFAPFGEISNCRVVRDPQTFKSKGYAFVSFVNKSEAEAAINAMNGKRLGSRSIRTNWSIRKPPSSERPRHSNDSKPDYEKWCHALEELLQCPVCLEVSQGVKIQCTNGHHICNPCRTQLQICPVCKSNFMETRNLAVEQISAKLDDIKLSLLHQYHALNRRIQHNQICMATQTEDIYMPSTACQTKSMNQAKSIALRNKQQKPINLAPRVGKGSYECRTGSCIYCIMELPHRG